MKSEMLYQLSRVQQTYQGRAVVDIQDLTIRRGELLVVVGPSGAGKSTLLRLLHGLELPSAGQIEFDGQIVRGVWPVAQRRRVGLLFQRPEFLDASVEENLSYPLRLRGLPVGDIVSAYLDRLQLTDLRHVAARQLSGGEGQRLALARAMIYQPEVLLLDEPTANLDPYNVELIEKLIGEFSQNGTTTVLVTHNIFQARRLAQRVGLMLNGEMIEVAGVEDFFEAPADARARAFVRGEMIY